MNADFKMSNGAIVNLNQVTRIWVDMEQPAPVLRFDYGFGGVSAYCGNYAWMIRKMLEDSAKITKGDYFFFEVEAAIECLRTSLEVPASEVNTESDLSTYLKHCAEMVIEASGGLE